MEIGPAARETMKVLVASADGIKADHLSAELTRLGCYCTLAETLDEAYTLARETDFALIAVVAEEGGVDALRLAKRLRAWDERHYALILAFGELSLKKAAEAGCDSVLSLPADSDALNGWIELASRLETVVGGLNGQLDHSDSQVRFAQTANQRFANLLAGLPVACLTVDPDRNIMEWNAEAEAVFECPAAEAWSQPLDQIIVQPDMRLQVQRLAEDCLNGLFARSLDWCHPNRNGTPKSLAVSCYPLIGPSGDVTGAGFVFTDVTRLKELERNLAKQLAAARELELDSRIKSQELKELTEQLERLAHTDGLTGLPNYRSLESTLQLLFAEAVDDKKQLSIAIADVDRFKKYNDTYGHLAGDLVLQRLGALLRDHRAGARTIVGRSGGEEFMFLLPGFDAESATAECARIAEAIRNYDWPEAPITASFGVATLDRTRDTLGSLLEAADQALYRSKADGRNRITHAGMHHSRAA